MNNHASPWSSRPRQSEGKSSRELGLSCKLAQTYCVRPHPSYGGSSRHPYWVREEQLQKWNEGEETKVSQSTLYRWSLRPLPHHKTGICARTQIIGTDLINLIIFIYAHPDAQIDDMVVYLYNKGGELYANQQISDCLRELDIMRKIASVKAY
jgi:hypothetical protein